MGIAPATDVPGSVSIEGMTEAVNAALAEAELPTIDAIGDEIAARLTAAIGVAIPTVAQIQDGLATETALGVVQAAVDALPTVLDIQNGLATGVAVAAVQSSVNALPSAASIATAVGAQAAAAAAITAAAGVAIPSVVQNQSGLATGSALSTLQSSVNSLPDNTDILAQCISAIQTESILSIQTACQNAVDSAGDSIASNTSGLVFSYHSGMIRGTATLSAGSTSGTILAAGGIGVVRRIWAILFSCTTSATDLTIVATGGFGSTAVHRLPIDGTLFLCCGGLFPVTYSNANTAITGTKTSAAIITCTVWYTNGS